MLRNEAPEARPCGRLHGLLLCSVATALTLLALPSAAALAAPPANDNFPGTTLSGLPTSATGTNVDATKETFEPIHAGNTGGHSVWWSWTAPSSGPVMIDICESDFDTLLAVYTGSAVNSLTPVAGNDDACLAHASKVELTATMGTIYRIAVDGYGGTAGTIDLNIAQPQCSDGTDNDGDGKTDFPADPDCADAADNDEAELHLADTPWPMFQRDLRHTGRTTLPGPPEPGVDWAFQTDADNTPAVGADGTIYLLGARKLHAINPNGTEKWAFDLPGSTDGPQRATTTPAIGSDGTIYVHGNGVHGNGGLATIEDYENLTAVNPNGTEKWTFRAPLGFDAPILSSPAIDPAGKIWLGTYSTVLYRLNPTDGSVSCSVSPSDSSIEASPAIAPDGTVYVVDASGLLSAYTSDCSLKWSSYRASGGFSPAVAADGTIWVGSSLLKAIKPDGSLKCQASTGESVPSTPAIAADGTVYAVGAGLYAFDPSDCSMKWHFAPFLSRGSSSPVVDGDGTIYWRTVFDAYAVNPDGTQKWTRPTVMAYSPQLEPSLVVGSAGSAYLVDSGQLLALVDNLPPETTITSGPVEGSTGNAPTPTFSFASDEVGSTFECRLDGGAFAGCVSPHTTTALAGGAHSFEVRATDQTGNTDPSPAHRSFTVGTVQPPPAQTQPPPATTPSPIGQRAAAIKRCKKKLPKGPKRQKCIKKAKRLPV